MAITAFPQIWLPASPGVTNGNLAFSAITLNASGDRLGFVIQCPKAGTLDWFEYCLSTVANNPDNGMRSSFQTVDAATGNPDGTQSQFRDITGTFTSNTWKVPPGVMTDDGTDVGVKRTVVAGEMLACVIDFVSFTASDSISFATLSVNSGGQQIVTNQYVADASTGTYAKSTTTLPILALKYSDGTYAEFDVPIWPLLTLNARTFNNASTPDERALRFQVPLPCRCAGAWIRMDLDNAADVVLYDAASSVLATASLDPDIRSVNGGVPFKVLWTAVDLAASTTYRLAIKPTTGSSIITYDFDVNAAALMACVSGGAGFYGSTRTDAGAWTDTTTQRPVMGLILDGFDNAGGGGSFDVVQRLVGSGLLG